MISDAEVHKMTTDEHAAWLASLNPVDSLAVHSAAGWRYTLVFVSLVKRLLEQNIPASFRLEYLEWLEKSRDAVVTPAVISLVSPMSDEAYELMTEIQKLPAAKTLDACAKLDVFSAFAALNPSLLIALRVMNVRGG